MAKAKTKKSFLLPDGKTTRHSSSEAIALQIEFENGTKETFPFDELPAESIKCLVGHGLSQKLGDCGAGKDSVDEFMEKVATVFEGLKEGRWIERAEGATRTSLLAEAISEVKPDKYPTVESAVEMLAGIDMKTDEGKARRKAIESIPEVKAVLERKKAERAAERAKKAAAEAQKSEGDSLESL